MVNVIIKLNSYLKKNVQNYVFEPILGVNFHANISKNGRFHRNLSIPSYIIFSNTFKD